MVIAVSCFLSAGRVSAEPSESSESSGSPTGLTFDDLNERGPHRIRRDTTVTLRDKAREKTLRLRVTWPDSEGPFPLIVWSHGMGGSKDMYDPLVEHWAGHGFVVIQPTHGDSLSLRRHHGRRPTQRAMLAEWNQRPGDVALILDSLEKIVADQPALKDKMDIKRIGVGGHSFGAHTAMLLAGAKVYPPGEPNGTEFGDKRPKTFVMISAQGTGRLLRRESYEALDRPTLFITGSRDTSPLRDEPPAWRVEPFRFSPPGERYLLYLDGAHHGFGGIAGVKVPYAGRGQDREAHVEQVRAVSLAMWRAHLAEDPAARAWLNKPDLEAATDGKAELFKRVENDQPLP